MLSLSQMQIIAYLGDGEVYCRKCGEGKHLPMSKALSEYDVDSQFSDGLSCGECDKEIVEYPAVCSICGKPERNCEHVNA